VAYLRYIFSWNGNFLIFTITLERVELNPMILFMNGNLSEKMSSFSPGGGRLVSSASSRPVPL